MAITLADFTKIWASTSPLTPYAFSDSNYQEGWNFVGNTPPSRQMWDFLQKQNDEKLKYLLDNFNDYLPLSGGTMTGTLTLADGGTALSDATVGTVVSASMESSTSVPASTATELCKVSLTKGVWVVTGHVRYGSVTADKTYAVTVSSVNNSVPFASDGTVAVHSSVVQALALQTSRIVVMESTGYYYLNGYATAGVTANDADINAVRIV